MPNSEPASSPRREPAGAQACPSLMGATVHHVARQHPTATHPCARHHVDDCLKWDGAFAESEHAGHSQTDKRRQASLPAGGDAHGSAPAPTGTGCPAS
jgi:hypothetical protein